MKRVLMVLPVALVSWLLLPGRAAADDARDACFTAYEQGQRLQKDGKLRAAHEEFVACSDAACPGFVRKDCSGWLDEVESSMPAVVLTLPRDAKGSTDFGGHRLHRRRAHRRAHRWAGDPRRPGAARRPLRARRPLPRAARDRARGKQDIPPGRRPWRARAAAASASASGRRHDAVSVQALARALADEHLRPRRSRRGGPRVLRRFRPGRPVNRVLRAELHGDAGLLAARRLPRRRRFAVDGAGRDGGRGLLRDPLEPRCAERACTRPVVALVARRAGRWSRRRGRRGHALLIRGTPGYWQWPLAWHLRLQQSVSDAHE